MINYLSWRCHNLSKARWYNFIPVFWKLSKGGTEVAEACDSCCIPGFCASIVLAFILGVELFALMVDGLNGVESLRAWLMGENQMGVIKE